MTKRSQIGGLALLSIVLLAGLWLALGGFGGLGEPEWQVAFEASSTGAIEPTRGSDPVILAAIPEQAPDSGQREGVIEAAESVEGVSAARRGWWRAPKGAIWVHGRVELPVGTPLDEELWVMAEGSKFRERADGGRTHWARVEDDGSFRVAFSSKTIKGKLEVFGRYLYLDKRVFINARKQVEEGEVVLEPSLGGRVVARVLPPRSVALEYDVFKGVEVKAVRGGFMGATLCDGRLLEPGEYELGGLEPGSTFQILASSPRFADGKAGEVEVEPGGTTYVDVPLAMGAHLAGEVLDADGVPVDGAIVQALSAGQMAQRIPFMKLTPQGETTTANGQFELIGVPPGDTTLVVEAEGFLDRELELGDLTNNLERTTLTIQLDRGRVMSGVVKWPDGSYAMGAKVLVAQGSDFRGMQMERVVGEVVLGPDGGFEFGGLLESECNVTATAIHPDDMPDMSSKLSRMKMKRIPRWTARLEEVSPGARNLILTLNSGTVLSGKVVDDQGKPVKIFKVTASPAGDNMFSMSSLKPVKGRFKDERGEFHLQGVETGEWEVRVGATGYGDSDRRTVTVPGSGDLRFVVPRTGLITGKVLSPRGEPLNNVSVVVTHGGSKTLTVKSAKDGVFLAGKVEPGTVEIVADTADLAASDPVSFELGPGGKREGLVVQLNRGAAVSGTIHADAGKPGGRAVNLSGPSDGSTKSDPEGRFEFEGLEPGSYELTLEPDSAADFGMTQDSWVMRFANSKQLKFELLVGEELEVVLGGRSPTALTVHGVVTQAGEPVPNALVMATESGKSANRPQVAVRTDGSGEYTMELDVHGQWRFQVGGDFGSRVTFMEDVPELEDVRIDFAIPTARILGVVTGPGGERLESMQVSLTAAENDDSAANDFFARRFEASGADGSFKFENLQPGTYVLRAGGPNRFGGLSQPGTDLGRVVVEATLDTDDEDVTADLHLPRAGKVRGLVQDASGVPLTRVSIRIADESGRRITDWDNERSGPDGRFELTGLGPGTYLISASQGDGEERLAGETKVRVYEGGEADALLTLAK